MRRVGLALCFAGSTLLLHALASDFESAVRERVSSIREWAADPTIVAAVRKANAEAGSLDEIREIDRRWQATAGMDDFMRRLATNAAAERLRELRARASELAEAFVTDRRGANVAMTNKTSDYWQGDEAKFTEAMAGGRGAVHLDAVGFDESIQAYAIQVSVPVWDGGAAIGVLVVTVNLEELERTRE